METLLHKIPQGEFECLLWERSMNKHLSRGIKKVREENGKLQSEMDEMKHNHTQEMDKLLREFKRDGKGQIVVKKKLLADQLNAAIAKNKKLTRENNYLVDIIIKKNTEALS